MRQLRTVLLSVSFNPNRKRLERLDRVRAAVLALVAVASCDLWTLGIIFSGARSPASPAQAR